MMYAAFQPVVPLCLKSDSSRKHSCWLP